ncbi:MAG: bifunctional glutamate N-acetyltransferase/amino-acid acetyltransferase ArgJ [Anaerolineaceae bacterium]|nr:bifunctional glutamate N-acetyltransferase/amino-acid acetyltransferase ArgJ [Anaerolineaceae bacterium]
MHRLSDDIHGVEGFRAAGLACGIKGDGVLDMALIVSDRDCAAGGVFTRNLVKAAPVLLDQELLRDNPEGMRALVVNSGCANACTGQKGLENARATGEMVAGKLGCDPSAVLVMSTGVIGVQLPMDRIREGVANASPVKDGEGWRSAARSFMTTDKFPKLGSARVELSGGRTVNIAGISKGAGMIAPDMATMLAGIATDAALTASQTRSLLEDVNSVSFNCIVVDGDTSTNDTVLLLANGASGVALRDDDDLAAFRDALQDLCVHLAQAIVRDGEGATRFVTIDVEGAADAPAARQIANTIATSALSKTAFYGSDANWGRFAAAAGRAGIDFDPSDLALWLGRGETLEDPLQLMQAGEPVDYDEDVATDIVSQPEFSLKLSIGSGQGQARVWTCDLGHEYVSINAEYRT